MRRRQATNGEVPGAPPGAVRMQDVAQLANVGTMTVSRVMNGTARVSEATTRRVFEAIEKLQYRPNQHARALRGSRLQTIGVLLPHLYDPFFAACAHAINEIAQEHGYSVIIATTGEDPARELEQARQMLRRQVDGMILIPTSEAGAMVASDEFRRVPIVTLDRPIPGSGCDSVICDNKAAGEAATKHLLAQGHRRICYLSLNESLYTMQMRYSGYEMAMKAAKLKPDAYFECGTQEEVLKVVESIWKRKPRPTAFFTANGLMTRTLLHALNSLDIAIPDDVAVVGFDDLELADILRPPLTVMRQPLTLLGRTAVELLFDRLHSETGPLAQRKVTFGVELIVRGSCSSCVSTGLDALPPTRVEMFPRGKVQIAANG